MLCWPCCRAQRCGAGHPVTPPAFGGQTVPLLLEWIRMGSGVVLAPPFPPAPDPISPLLPAAKCPRTQLDSCLLIPSLTTLLQALPSCFPHSFCVRLAEVHQGLNAFWSLPGERALRWAQQSRLRAQGSGSWEGRRGRRGGRSAGVTLMQPRARQPATLVCTSSSSSCSRKHSRAWVRVGGQTQCGTQVGPQPPPSREACPTLTLSLKLGPSDRLRS